MEFRDHVCPLCREDWGNDRPEVRLGCGHVLHLGCLEEMFSHSLFNCPYDQRPIHDIRFSYWEAVLIFFLFVSNGILPGIAMQEARLTILGAIVCSTFFTRPTTKGWIIREVLLFLCLIARFWFSCEPRYGLHYYLLVSAFDKLYFLVMGVGEFILHSSFLIDYRKVELCRFLDLRTKHTLEISNVRTTLRGTMMVYTTLLGMVVGWCFSYFVVGKFFLPYATSFADMIVPVTARYDGPCLEWQP